MQALFEKEKAYWSGKFDSEDQVISLPYAHASSKSISAGSTQTYAASLPATVSQRIQAISGGSPIAVFMILLAGVKGLLYKYTSEAKIIVGVPAFPASQDAAALLNPLVLLKTEMTRESTFKTLLQGLRAAVGEAIEHQNTPFWNYADLSNVQRDADGITRVSTIVSLAQVHTADFSGQVAADLHLQFSLENGSIALNAVYDTRFYDEETLARAVQHLEQLFAVVLFQPDLPAAEADVLSEEEKTQLLSSFNNTQADYPRDLTIQALFEQQAERTPEHVAVVYGDTQLTYRELNEKANRLAGNLQAEGVQADALIGIMADRSIEMVVGVLAILKAGGAYVPVDPNYPDERIRYLLEDSAAKVLLAQRQYIGLAAFDGTVIDLNDDASYSGEAINPVTAAGPEHLAYVIYTSGSTGKPKGVMVEQRNVVRLVQNTDFAELNESTRILQTGAVVFDASTFEIWGALLNGGQLVLVPGDVILDGAQLKHAIQKHSINTMWLTAPLFNQLSQQESRLFVGLKTLIVGGDVLSVPHINRVLAEHPGLLIVNGYGPTENTTFSTTHAIREEQHEAVPIGRPIRHSTAYVVDASLKLVPIGAWGELIVGGDGVARGYLNRDDLTAEKFIADPFVAGARVYRTGDLARWRADGIIEYKGRIDEQVKIRGYRIELAEIETELLKVDSIQEAVVVVREDANGQKTLAAYFTADRAWNASGLRSALAQELPGYMMPSYFVQMEQIPLTPNGKVDKRALPAPEDNVQSGGEYVAPRTPIETQLEQIWKEILGLPAVSVTDNFFDIGGHSLRATNLVSAVHKQLQANIQLSDVFQKPTIEELAGVIESMDQTAHVEIPVAETREYYPVSTAQRRMYIMSQLAGAEVSYNMPNVMVLEGPLDHGRVEEAFRKLIARHETLRTSFEAINGKPVQRVHANAEFALEYHEAAEQDADGIVRGFVRPFDLAQAPLIRVGLVATAPERHILLFDMHHIISDGSSMNVLIEEFIQLYDDIELRPLRVQYKDFAVWQQELADQGRFAQVEKDWLAAFSGELPVLELPTDFPRPATRSFQGSVYEFALSHEQSDALRRIAAQTGSTLYMVLLAAYTTLLYKYSGQEDIIVGAPVAGRPHADLLPLIGMFVNTLAIRHEPAGTKAFIDYVREVKTRTLKAFENQDYPLEELIEKLELKRDLSRNPLFDTVFILQNLESGDGEVEGLRVKPYPSEHKVAKFDLTLFASEHDGLIQFGFEYASALFKRETVARMALHLTQLLETVSGNPQVTLGEAGIITPAETAQILKEFNNTATAFPRDRSIGSLLEEQAALRPDATAVSFGDQSLTYRELNEQANRLARTLVAEGVQPDEFVALMTERSLDMIVGIFGILKVGAAYVPLDPEYPEDRVRYVLEDSGARLLVRHGRLENRVAFYEGKHIVVDDPSAYADDGSNLSVAVDGNSLAYIIYTSGTTGKPKGTLTTHRSITRLMRDTKYIDIQSSDIFLQVSSYAFDGSTFDIFSTLLNGAKLILVDKDSFLQMDNLSRLIERENVTMMFLTTTLFNVLIDVNIESLRTMRKILFGGERASILHVRKALRYLGAEKLINVYGPTEGTVFATYYPVDELSDDAISLPIGRPIDNSIIYIVGQGNTLNPIGIPGELCVAGDGLARGYLNKPEVTAEKFTDNPFAPGERMYRTGDLAKWLPDGNIEFLGRFDDQVKIRGYRIELGEVEAQVLSVDGITEATVVALEDEFGQKLLCAYFVAERSLPVNEIRAELAKELPAYMVPSYFVQLDEMPLTMNGKVNRRALPKPQGDAHTGEEYVAPRTPEEAALATVWQSVLGSKRIGILDNFFDLGGDSIKSIQVSSRLFQAGFKMEMKDLFQNPTIAALGQLLKPVGRIAEQGEISGPTILTPVIQWFFENNLAAPHHFNQSVMLYRKEGFEVGALGRAIRKIAEHHDALRLVFDRTESGEYEARIRKIEEGELFTLETVDFTGEADCAEAVETKATEIQGRIDLGQGPLIKLGLFHCPDGDHLLIAIHHLAVDGVSWRVLFEDIASAYEQALQGEAEIRLPQKTDSFQFWAEQLSEYAQGQELQRQREYWQHIASARPLPLPQDKETGPALLADSESVTATWSAEETERLLKQAHRAYNTEVNDLLLTALGVAVHAWTGSEQVLINLEGHGRESIIPDVDVTRTVGWFTSQYPVLLEIGANTDVAYRIKTVKDGLRRIPHKGVGFGILKYLSKPKDESLFGVKPEISFNYLGQFDQDLEHNAIEPSAYSYGLPLSMDTERAYTLDINGMISGGQLGLSISYNSKSYHQETMERLAELLRQSLLDIIAHCASKEKPELTPSDVSLKGLSVEGLEDLLRQTSEVGEMENVYGLTAMQKGMLFHSRLDPHSGAYFERVSYDVLGDFDPVAFEAALSSLTGRHAALRSNFYYGSQDQPLQVVFRSRTDDFHYEDIRHLEETAQAEYLQAFMDKDRKRGFDLSRDALLRISVLRTGDASYRFVWSFHHIVMDGWCLSLVNGEVFEGYFAIQQQREPNLAEVTPYSVYIEWLEGQSPEEAIAYWRDYLAGYEQQTTVPSLTMQPTEGYTKGEYFYELDHALTARMNKIARENQVTINTLMQTAWGIVLQQYNNNRDVVFGSVVSGRPAHIPGVEAMIGLFINTIPVRIRCEEEDSFIQAIRRTQAQALASQDFDTYPLFEIQALSEQKHELINHIMVFENFPVEQQVEQAGGDGAAQSEFRISNVELLEQTSYEFNLTVMPGEDIMIGYEYNAHKYSASDIKRIAGHFIHVLEQITENPDVRVSDIELVTAAEKEHLLAAFSTPALESPERLPSLAFHRLFEAQAERTPDHLAVVYADRSLTYRELNEKANQLAGALREHGIGREVIVGILADRSVEMLIGVLAAWKAGGAYVPLDPDYPADRIQLMLEDSGAQVLLTQRHLSERAVELLAGDQALKAVLYLDDETLYEGDKANHAAGAEPEDLAYIIYTSGTTGRPKGVMIEQRSLVNTADANRREYRLTEFPVRLLQLASFSFDVFAGDLSRTLLNGGTMYICPKEDRIDPSRLAHYLVEYGITVFESTPALIIPLMDHIDRKQVDISALRLLITGSDSCSVTDYRNLQERFGKQVRIINSYGVTEAAIDSSYYDEPLDLLPAAGNVPIGKAHMNARFYIVSANLAPVPVGVIGELCIGGAGVARGYMNRTDLTEEKFVPNPFVPGERLYRTGDLARWTADGNVDFIGRIDHQVKIRGYRVELGEIETALLQAEGVRQAVVIDRADERGQKYLCGYAASELALDVDALLRHLRDALPPHMVPTRLVTLERLPLTPNGKIDRKALPAPEGVIPTGADFVAPRTATEAQLAQIWQDVLGVPTVGIKDDFFDLGGHSLKVLELIRKIDKELDIELPIRSVFEAPTVEGLARAVLRSSLSQERALPVTQLNETGKLNVFCFPPIAAFGLSFAELAKQLDGTAIVQAFDFIDTFENDADLFAQYVGHIRSIQEEGPYVLIGYSLGGSLAHEVAKALEAEGHIVSDIIMIDSIRSLEATVVSREEVVRLIDEALDNVDEAYKQAIGEKHRNKIYAYSEYDNRMVNTGTVQAHIHGLMAAQTVAEGLTADQRLSWSNGTAGTYTETLIVGSHDELLDPDFVEENGKVVKQILEQIAEGAVPVASPSSVQ